MTISGLRHQKLKVMILKISSENFKKFKILRVLLSERMAMSTKFNIPDRNIMLVCSLDEQGHLHLYTPT